MRKMVQDLVEQQLSVWDMARHNYEALKFGRTKSVYVNGYHYKVQFNPARIVSSAAVIDKKTIQNRACFLCSDNRPSVQRGIPFGDNYQILLNPFPIFPKHLTIPKLEHTDQCIRGEFGSMLDLARSLDEYVVFYNGPRCGASAPDHAHFQAGIKGCLPLETEWINSNNELLAEYKGAKLWCLNDSPRTAIVVTSNDRDATVDMFDFVYEAMELGEQGGESMMNILVWIEGDMWITAIFPRRKHRPNCYTLLGEDNILISPASVDMGGMFITPRESDFEKIVAENIESILAEVCLTPDELYKFKERIKDQLWKLQK